MKKFRIIIGAFICAIILLHTKSAYAGNEINIEVDGDIYVWPENDSNGKVEKTEDGVINITYDATSSETLYSFYQISSIFKDAYVTDIFSDSYKAVAIDIANNSDVEINLGFTLVDRENNKLLLSKNAYILKDVEGMQVSEKVTNGNIILEKGFIGKIFIPLEFLIDDEGNEAEFNYQKLTSWALSLLVEGKNKANISINKLVWLDNEYMNKFEQCFNTYIEGMTEIQLPEHGEAIYFYDIISENDSVAQSYKFVSDGFDNGIKLDANGKLTLDTSCEEQKIEIKAVNENGISIIKKLVLKKSWRDNNEDFSFNGPEDLEKIEYPFDFVTNNYISIIRIIILTVSVVILSTYIVFYAKYKLDKRKEEM